MLLGSGHCVGGDGAGEHPVLRVVLEVASGEGGTGVVGEAVGPEEVGDFALSEGKLIDGGHHVLARRGAGIGDGDIEGDGPIALGDGAHFLSKGGVAQAVAEGVLDRSVIVDQALGGGGLIELVAHVDALHIVHEGGRGPGGVEAAGVAVELLGVGVFEVAEVVPPGSGLHIIDSCNRGRPRPGC